MVASQIKPPPSDFIRVGLVARNKHGVTIWWARKEIFGRPNPLEGKAMAVVLCVNTALHQGWRNVIVETDCLPVHRYLPHSSSDFVSFGAILDACFSLSSLFCSLSFSFARRLGNSLAHST